MNTISPTKSLPLSHDSWRQQPDVFTQNDVIDAYLRGKEAGRNDEKIAMNKLFETNLKQAQALSEKLLRSLQDLGITVQSIYLKAGTITNFMSLFVVDSGDYLSDKFLEGITIARALKKAFESEDFTISFIYTHNAPTLDEHCMDSDGYFMKYANK